MLAGQGPDGRRTESLQHSYQSVGAVDHRLSSHLIDRNAFESEPVPHQANTNAGVPRGPPVDQRIADERRVRWRGGHGRHEMAQARRIRLARKGSIAADDAILREKPDEIKASQNA